MKYGVIFRTSTTNRVVPMYTGTVLPWSLLESALQYTDEFLNRLSKGYKVKEAVRKAIKAMVHGCYQSGKKSMNGLIKDQTGRCAERLEPYRLTEID